MSYGGNLCWKNHDDYLGMAMKKYCIVGCGGCGQEVLGYLEDILGAECSEKAVFMVTSGVPDRTNLDIPVIHLDEFDPTQYLTVVAIGSPYSRRAVVEQLPSNTEYGTLIHPSAVVSKRAQIGVGTIIAPGCVVTASVQIGAHSHINYNSTISHDSVVGDYFTTGPGAHLNGNCTVGHGVYLGSNAAVKQRTQICSDVVIGMGGVVVKDIIETGTYVGVPVHKISDRPSL